MGIKMDYKICHCRCLGVKADIDHNSSKKAIAASI